MGRGLVVAALGCALALSACTGGSSGDRPGASGTMPSATVSAIPAVRVGATTAVTPSAPEALPVLGRADTSDDGVRLSIALNEVRVSGQLLQVSFTVTNRQPTGANHWQVSDFFADGVSQAASSTFSSVDAFTVDGMYVLDPKNAKRYLVARDPNHVCVCTGNTSGTFIDSGSSMTFTGTYKAPPEDVTAVTVVVPNTPPFQNVPVQR